MSIKERLNNLYRVLETKQASSYTAVFIITVVFIGVGLYPLYKVVSQKMGVLNDLVELYTNLRNKKDILISVPAELTDTQIYLSQLRTAIPDNVLLQEYLVRMSEVSSGSGYQQQRVTIVDLQEEEAIIGARFLGVMETFPTLVQKVEAMNRLTEITKIDLKLRDKQAIVDMELKVYFL